MSLLTAGAGPAAAVFLRRFGGIVKGYLATTRILTIFLQSFFLALTPASRAASTVVSRRQFLSPARGAREQGEEP